MERGERRLGGKRAPVPGGERLSGRLERRGFRRGGVGVDVLLWGPRRALLLRRRGQGLGGRNLSTPRICERLHRDQRRGERGREKRGRRRDLIPLRGGGRGEGEGESRFDLKLKGANVIFVDFFIQLRSCDEGAAEEWPMKRGV